MGEATRTARSMVRRRLGERQPQPGGLVHLDRPRHRDADGAFAPVCRRRPLRARQPARRRARWAGCGSRGTRRWAATWRSWVRWCRTARRLLREASLCAQLEHPGIVPMHDIRCCKGRLFYVVRGQTRDGVEVYGMTEEQTLGFATICRAQPLRASPRRTGSQDPA